MKTFSSLDALRAHLSPEYSNLPEGRYIHLFLLRETQTEAIFRTEGTGEPLSRELVNFEGDAQSVEHAIITKRKQVAVERRTGREALRRLKLLKETAKGELCLLNTNNPCERCIDCWVYGFAAGGGGAQRSRVMTEDAYSLLPAHEIIDSRTGNATYDNGTMRHPVTGDASQALFESEYIKPQSVFLDIQTLKDVQAAELIYVLGNILRSTRYGAVGTRIGRVNNRILAMVGTEYEVTSNLEWTGHTQQALRELGVTMAHPLKGDSIAKVATEQAVLLSKKGLGKASVVQGSALDAVLAQARDAYENPDTWLVPLAQGFDALAESYQAKKGKTKGKKK